VTTPAQQLGTLAEALQRPSVLLELAVLAGCLLLAWLVTHFARGHNRHPDSVWFAGGAVDGVLFPLLALAFTWTARRALEGVLPIALLRLAVPILISLLAIRLTARVLRVAFPTSAVVRVIERTVSWLAWIGVVLWVTGVLPLLLEELDRYHWKIGGSQVSLRNLIEAVVSALVVMVIALWTSSAIEARLLRGAALADLSLRKIAANATRALLLFVGLMLALTAAGLDLTVLSVFGGALGVGIGFGLQKLASNYISGFVILAERALRIGDWVKVDNFEGRIIDISTRFTVVRALSGREANVPNEMLITQRVENYTRADPKQALTTSVTVARGSDVPALLPRLAQAVRSLPQVLGEPAPNLQLSAFKPEGIELTVQFWVADITVNQGNVKSEVNLALLRELSAARVELR
jgi:small-conductance mechanosensitive channel